MRYLEYVGDGVDWFVNVMELFLRAVVVVLWYALAYTVGIPFALVGWFIEWRHDRKIMRSIEKISNPPSVASLT